MPKRTLIMQAAHRPGTALLVAGLLMLAAGLGGCEREKPKVLPYLFEEDVVLAFGDSLTHGSGAKQQESYPAVLSGLIGRRVINAGVPGETTAEGLERLPGAVKKYSPELVLLCLGGNDFLRKRPAANTHRNLDAMLSYLKQEGIPVVLIAVPRPGLSLDADPVYEQLADQHDVLLVEDLMADVLGEKALKSDQIHPNAQGYREIARALAEVLDRHGAI